VGWLLLNLLEAPLTPGFVTLGFELFLFLEAAKGTNTWIRTRGGLLEEGEGILSEDSSPPSKDSIRSEELGSLRGVTSLSNMVL